MTYRLVLATEKEEEKYRKAGMYSGLSYFSDDIKAVENDPLAKQQYNESFCQGNPRTRAITDHRHLSVATIGRSKLVQWSARMSSGYHYGFGKIMKIVKA